MTCSVFICDAPAVYRAVMSWCGEWCGGSHPVCISHGADLRSDPGLVRLHTLEAA